MLAGPRLAKKHQLESHMKLNRNRHQTTLVTLCGVASMNLHACMHKHSQREMQGGAQSRIPGWIDLSTTSDGKTRQTCPIQSTDVNDEVQCSFKDASTGLVWSSRAPGQDGFREAREYLTWSEAKSACEKLGQWSGIDGWRLPTEAELTSAFLTPSGGIRQSGLLGVTDTISSFGLMPKYSLIWSLNEDPRNPNQAKALLRGATNISIGTVAKDMARGWHCVHSSANAIEPTRTISELPIPLTSAPLEPTPNSDRPRLPPVKPAPPTSAEVKASSMLGQTKGITTAPKWTIKPISDFDRLSFILNPNELPKTAPTTLEHPPELPNDIPQPKPTSTLSRKSFVKALKSAFAQIGMTHAIDENGRLVLNKASGIKFPSGEGNLSKSSLPRARNMLRIYTEVLLAELPETAATARLAVVGYSTPSLKMNPASTQQANKKISLIRAELIREIITEFNIWPPDQITIDGLGNVNPIQRSDRGQGECGAYDCELSRRVEISPIFKENMPKK